MDAMESKMAEWRRRMPSKRALSTQLGHLVQQKSVAVLYTQSEQDRIKNVTELITTATDAFDKGDHRDRITKVVDVLGNTSNKHVLKEAIRFVRLRLGDSSPRVVLLTLTLTETLMKHCNNYVRKEIASESFMAGMEALYKVHSCKRGRDSMEIEGRVLELIQTWGESFMNQKFEFPYFIYTYEKLRKKGVKFPKYDKAKAPLFSSAGSARGSRSSSSAASSASSAKPSASLAKLSSKEVYHVATNVAEMFEDMLTEAERDATSIADRGVIVELAAQAQELLMRLQDVIQSAADADSEELGKYLSVNDTLHTALTRYDDLKKNGNNQKTHGSKATSASNNQTEDDDDDDGFGDFVRARVGGDSKPAASNQANDDDDDLFGDFVSQRAKPTASAAPAKDLIDLWDDEPLAPTPAVQPQPVAATTADIWGDDTFLQPAVPAPVAAPVPAHKSNASPFDDLWGDLAPAPAAPIRQQVPAPIAPPVNAFAPVPLAAANTANPFDFFDDFKTKATISAPPSQPAAPVKANPFDFGFPPPPASQQVPAVPAKPAAPLNPFDF